MYRLVIFVAAGQPAKLRELLAMLDLTYRSAMARDPGCTLTVLSDETTDLGGIPPATSVSRHRVDRSDLMMARTRAQAEFAAQYDFAQPLAFLDLDILVNRPIAWLYDRPFDIAVTTRRREEMSVNGGVILANTRSPAHVRAFFTQLLEIYAARYAHLSEWWGDQSALAELVPLAPDQRNVELLLTLGGIDYLLLPTDQYNVSPRPRELWRTLATPNREAYLLHFKGRRRKRFMQPYFDLHIAGGRGPRALRVAAAYGRAAWPPWNPRHGSKGGIPKSASAKDAG